MRISLGGRHFIGNQETLDTLVKEIIPRTQEAASTKTEGYDAVHKLRVNIPLGDNTLEYAKQINSLRKKHQGEIDISFMIGRGPGVSFKDLLMQREGEVTVLYGAEDMDIRVIQPEVAWMASQMIKNNMTLGVGCRPQVMLHQVPEADVMRQLHEVYYALAAGAKEGLQPENPFNLDLSKGPSIFVGDNGKGGFGDITSGLSLFNHVSNSLYAGMNDQEVANYFSYITSIIEPEMFTSEYALHIHVGIDNTLRTYTSYDENKFYERKTEFSDSERSAAMYKIDGFISFYNQNLMKIPEVRDKILDTVQNPDTKQRILSNLGTSWNGFTKVATPEELVERVDSVMKKQVL